MSRHPFSQVDVFGAEPLQGNALAVVHLDPADAVPTPAMQELARWTGLSETTFLVPPSDPAADYGVRIFTTSRELPFAGHPTLGSAYAWLRAGGRPRHAGVVVQECGAGLVPVRVRDDVLAFAAPPLTRYEPIADELRRRIAAGLGLGAEEILDASWLVNGPTWIGLRLPSAERVLAVRVDQVALAGLDLGVVGPYPSEAEVAFEVRALLPGDSVAEDPVTGSLHAGLARWLIDTGQAPQAYVAAQGQVVGATGRVQVGEDGEALWVGGRVAGVIRGEVSLPTRGPGRRP